MNKLFASWFLLGLAAALPAQPPAPEPRIQVSIYNQAGVHAATLDRALREAARIYRRVGLELNWVDCPLTPDGPARVPSCYADLAPDRLALRVLPGKMSAHAGSSGTVYGVALLPQDGGFGMVAQICAECCARLAKGDPAREAAFLGYVMAHELGHLLLGDPGHTLAGLMHIPWTREEQTRISQGTLLFTSEQAAKMRRNAAARLQAEAPVLTAGK
ncbi:MAG: hypothetical protein ABSC08_15715 [Bryobacteraceae bacterium]